MPLFTIRVNRLVFDRTRFIADFDAAVKLAWREGLRAFLKAALERVPIESGMAASGFRSLADFLGEEIDLSGAKPTLRRNSSLGAAQSILDVSEFDFPTYKVTLDIEILHFRLMDHFGSLWNERARRVVLHEPWNSIEHGRRAFRDYVANNINLPEPSHYYTRVSVPFGRRQDYL